MSTSLPIPYQPAPPPNTDDVSELTRYTYDELTRLAQGLINLQQPVALTVVDNNATIPIGPLPVWERLFVGITPEWAVPSNTWNSATAEWTNPQDGLFNMSVVMEVQPFGIGNKDYYAGLRITVVKATGAPDVVYEVTDSGVDDFPLGVTLVIALPLYKGDVVYFEAAAVHENQTGTVDVDALAQITRISAA